MLAQFELRFFAGLRGISSQLQGAKVMEVLVALGSFSCNHPPLIASLQGFRAQRQSLSQKTVRNRVFWSLGAGCLLVLDAGGVLSQVFRIGRFWFLCVGGRESA